MDNPTQHRFFDLARRAYEGTSFVPEKRAEDFCANYDEEIAYLKSISVPQAAIERYESLVARHLYVKSKCFSVMIAGGSNFPVRKAEKANAAEQKASLAAADFYKKIIRITKKHSAAEKLEDKIAIPKDKKEIVLGDLRILENAEDMRLQLFFSGKPEAEIIQILKKNGFKWAPSVGAWQRLLNNNALYALKHFVLPHIKNF